MPKGIREPYQELEGGKGFGGMGGGGGGGGRSMSAAEKKEYRKDLAGLAGYMAPPVLVGTAGITAGRIAENERREKAEREAAAELKRESQRGMKAGGKVSSASSRGDGIAAKGKTKGRMV